MSIRTERDFLDRPMDDPNLQKASDLIQRKLGLKDDREREDKDIISEYEVNKIESKKTETDDGSKISKKYILRPLEKDDTFSGPDRIVLSVLGGELSLTRGDQVLVKITKRLRQRKLQ